MKITLICGSARTDGSCNYLLDTFIQNTGAAEIKKYQVSELNMNYCRGCKSCYTGGECVFDDGVREVVCDMLMSDIVVIAVPSYWADVPAQLKTLIDRTTPYGNTNPNRNLKAEKPVKGVAIAVRAGVREAENELILNAIEHYFGHLGIETAERISVTKCDSLKDLLNQNGGAIMRVAELARKLTERI